MAESLKNKDLIETIQKQQAELQRYKTRLKDLVTAHKCLLKEKELLESSLRVLNHSAVIKRDSSEPSTSFLDDSATSDEGTEESSDVESTGQLKSQMNTLMNSLATLSEEKSRMEAGFLADKKQLRADKQELEKVIKELQNRIDHETRAHLSEMENFKSKLIIERHQREKEHNDHGVMIRELQKVVSEERVKREKAETNMESLRGELAQAVEANQQCKREASEARGQLEDLRGRLKDREESSGAATLRLKHELTLLKEQLIQSSAKEQEKLDEAEKRSRKLAASHEERVASLEAKLAELSAAVGNYDRLRQGDQEAIATLKGRLYQLEMEGRGEEKGDMSVDDLVGRLKEVKEQIVEANKASEKPVDIKGIMMELLPNSFLQESHKICQEEYEQLKNEFDNYKSQFPMQQCDSSSYRSTQGSEEELKSQIAKLKTRVRDLHTQIEDMEASHKKEIESLNKEMMSERRRGRERCCHLEAEWRGRVANLEAGLAKQRQRAASLVADKERELADLKESLASLFPTTLKTGEEGPLVLHHTEEIARRDVELTRLRKEIHQLQTSLKEADNTIIQMRNTEGELRRALKLQLERLDRYQNQGGESMEYLKNVLLQFLVIKDHGRRIHMLNAITAVIGFTETEKARIQEAIFWWRPPPE